MKRYYFTICNRCHIVKNMEKTSSSNIQVIDRLTALLNALARHGGSASLKWLAAETGLHTSTAFRILAAAQSNGFVERTAVGHYCFGHHLAHWSRFLSSGVSLRDVARPIMEALRDQVEETVNLTSRVGNEVVYVERATSKRMMRVEQVIGSHAPLHVTAVGKLMLGVAGKTAVRDYAKETGLPAYTPHTFTTQSGLWTEASRCVQQGYALDNEEAEIGVGCIGVLVRDASGAVVAGLSISAPIERRKADWIALVQAAAHEIADRLRLTDASLV
jgi:IclR family transcriptional regulator, acetate operon repressor